MKNVKSGEIYRHFKGNKYEIVAIAKDSETLNDIVVYKNVEKGDVWTRPLDNFCELVTRDGLTFARFEKMDSGE